MKKYPIFFSVFLMLGAGCTGTTAPTEEKDSIVAVENTAPATARLDLSGKSLENLPSSLFEKTHLEELDLSGNRLTGALPGEIRHLKRLRLLDASENLLSGVPAEIGQLSALQILDLSNNNLTGLPMELGNLKNLLTLDLRGNDVSRQDLEAIRAALTSATKILAD